MPSTLNGFGTMYYGRSNVRREEGVCEHCGYHGVLSSYDTGYFIVALFVPLIPLGGQHIYNECPSCKKHRRISIQKIGKMKQEGVTSVREELAKNRIDMVVLKNWLESFYAFQDPEPLNKIAYDVIEACQEEPAILLTLSELFSFYKDRDQALACALLAQKKDRGSIFKEAVAEQLIYCKKPLEAESYLEHLWGEQASLDKYWLAALLAEGFMVSGYYAETQDVLERMQTSFAEPECQTDIGRLQSVLDKVKKSNSAPHFPHLAEADKPYDMPKKYSNKAVLIGPAVALILITLYLVSSVFIGAQREVYLINGTPFKYSVKIDSKKYELWPLSSKLVRLPEGTHEIETSSLDSARNTQKITLKSNFLTRPIALAGKTYVVNPDHCGLLYEADCEYGVGASSELRYRYRSLGLLHVFTGIDYEFMDFPDSIETSSDGVVTKTGLGVISGLDGISPIIPAYSVLSPDSARLFVAKYATINPIDENALHAFSNLYPEEALNFFRDHLHDRPLNMELHRTYQTLVLAKFPDIDLKKEYNGYLATDSLNSELLYLAGRVMDESEDLPYFLKSIDCSNPSPYSFNALAYDYYNSGEFEKGAVYASKAVNLMVSSNSFRDNYYDCLYASRNYHKLLEELEKELGDNPSNFSDQLYKFEVLLRMDNLKDAALCIDQCSTVLKNDGVEDLRDYMTAFDMCRFILKKDLINLKKLYANDSYYKLYEGLISGDMVLSDSILSDDDTDNEHLFLGYLIAKEKNKNDLATEYYTRAVAGLKKGGRLYLDLISLLEGSATRSTIDDFSAQPEDKALYYAVLGMKYPQFRSHCFSQARSFNYKANPRKSILDLIL